MTVVAERLCLLAGAMLACAVSTTRADCRAESGPGTAALVELYTSEGCSSCPPADRWLGELPAAEIAQGRVIPVALHVTYWDDLGWKDPFASAEFTARQRRWQAINKGRYVYTPQVVLAGRDDPDWSSAAFWRDVKAVNDTPARANIVLEGQPQDGGRLAVKATVGLARPDDRRHAALFIALTQDGVSSRVAAGENRGSTLRHQHLARDWAGPLPLGPGAQSVISRTLALPESGPASTAGVVAFVEDLDAGRILQAVAVTACR